MRRIKSVEREYLIVSRSLQITVSDLIADPNSVLHGTRPRDYEAASEHLGATYLIRLYAEFEAGLRNHYASVKSKNPNMEVLVDTLAGRYRIPVDVKDDVHQVRNCRNGCVHNCLENLCGETIRLYRSYLCRYFDRLPSDWKVIEH